MQVSLAATISNRFGSALAATWPIHNELLLLLLLAPLYSGMDSFLSFSIALSADSSGAEIRQLDWQADFRDTREEKTYHWAMGIMVCISQSSQGLGSPASFTRVNIK